MKILLPEKTLKTKHNFVYIGYMKDPNTNKYVRNNECYCFTCKKIIQPKVETIKITKFNNDEIFDINYFNNQYYKHEWIYECPYCGKREFSKDIINNSDTLLCYRNYFLDDNKLKINLCYLNFNIFNEKLVLKETKKRITLNLDTGYSYIFAPMINKKIKKRTIKNISYITDVINIDNPNIRRCTDKCQEFYSFYQEVFNKIREYKIKKMNIYLPEENLKDNNKIYYKKKVYINSLQRVLLFNRFPTVRRDCICNILLSLQKNDKKQFKYLKHDSKDPIKDILISFKLPTSKKAKNKTIININYPYYSKQLFKIFKSYDNINKILQDDFLKKINFNEFMFLIDDIKYYKKNFKFNENIFCNKFNAINSEFKRDIFCDMIFMIKLIKNFNKDYEINNKLSFDDLHNIVALDYSKYKHPNKKIEIEEKYLKLEYVYDDLHFNLAKSTHELIEVGSKMNICVGTYGEKAFNKECNIVVVRNKDNSPKICIELDNEYKKIKQIKLCSNHYISKSTHEKEYYAIKKWIENNNLILNTHDFIIEEDENKICY